MTQLEYIVASCRARRLIGEIERILEPYKAEKHVPGETITLAQLLTQGTPQDDSTAQPCATLWCSRCAGGSTSRPPLETTRTPRTLPAMGR